MSVENNKSRVRRARLGVGLTSSLLMAVGLAGCANFSQRPQSAWRGLDSQAPLGAQKPIETLRLPSPPREPKDTAASPDTLSRRPLGSSDRLEAPSPRSLPKLNTAETDEIV